MKRFLFTLKLAWSGPPHKWRGACACVSSLRLQRHLFLHVSPMRDGSGHRPRRPFSRGHSGEKSRLAPSPTGRGRSLRDVMLSRPECVGLGFIQQTSPGSLGVREPETRARCWISGCARTRSFPHTHARAHSSRHSPTHTLACVRARRHTPTCACSWAHAPHVHPRACVRACRRSRAIAHMRVCVQTHTPAHSHTCGSTRDAGTLPAAGASAPTAVSRDLRLRSRRRAGLCVLSREGREEAALGDPEGAS